MSTSADSPVRLDVVGLRRLLDTGHAPRLIDVRTPGEFRNAHIPGSYNVPLDLLREHRTELRNHLDEQVVLICKAGGRAAQAERALAETGLPNLRVLDGGIAAWMADDGPVNRGDERWELERQVRLVAGSLVLLAILLSIVFPPAKWVAAFVGAGLTFAAVTNTCAMGMLLAKLPYNRGPRTTVEDVFAALRAERS